MRGGEPCFGAHRSQLTFSTNKDKETGLNQVLTNFGLFAPIVAVFLAELAAGSRLPLVIFCWVSGCVSPMADSTGRMAYTLPELAIPVVANSLDVMPGIGAHPL